MIHQSEESIWMFQMNFEYLNNFGLKGVTDSCFAECETIGNYTNPFEWTYITIYTSNTHTNDFCVKKVGGISFGPHKIDS